MESDVADPLKSSTTVDPFPEPDGQAGLAALRVLVRNGSMLASLEALHQHLGEGFRLNLPGFRPVVVSGPEAGRQVLISQRNALAWRTPTDPVTRLLRHGLLVEDGVQHAGLRAHISPSLRRAAVQGHVSEMLALTDDVAGEWQDGATLDMLVEMRKLALLILMNTLFGVQFEPHLDRLWKPILRLLKYISPGAWLIWPGLPRPGFRDAIKQVDSYLYETIAARRLALRPEPDLISHLIRDAGMTDELIRDQLLTLLIAGHDTSTAQLSWTLYLLGSHPQVYALAREEVDRVFGTRTPSSDEFPALHYLDQVSKEALRLYPPIHVGNRRTLDDLDLLSHRVPPDQRLMFSIYLTHRDERQWPDPQSFNPDRFARGERGAPDSFAYLPFGGGPRNCIGALFAQVEARAVLARLIQRFDFELLPGRVGMYMGATLEPHPGVFMRVHARTGHA